MVTEQVASSSRLRRDDEAIRPELLLTLLPVTLLRIMMPQSSKIILAVTGASGSVYAKKLLDILFAVKNPPTEIAVILSDNAREIWEYETGNKFTALPPAKEYSNKDFYVPFASGSCVHETMIICPASMGVLGRIANGTSEDLISRAADVMLKERRKLIIVPREAPYNLIHIRNMETLTLAGAIICPATPSFYSKPQTIDDLVMTVVERIITLAGFETGIYRWMNNG